MGEIPVFLEILKLILVVLRKPYGEKWVWPYENVARQQKTPFGRTLPFRAKRVLPLSRGWHCPQGVLLVRWNSADLKLFTI